MSQAPAVPYSHQLQRRPTSCSLHSVAVTSPHRFRGHVSLVYHASFGRARDSEVLCPSPRQFCTIRSRFIYKNLLLFLTYYKLSCEIQDILITLSGVGSDGVSAHLGLLRALLPVRSRYGAWTQNLLHDPPHACGASDTPGVAAGNDCTCRACPTSSAAGTPG